MDLDQHASRAADSAIVRQRSIGAASIGVAAPGAAAGAPVCAPALTAIAPRSSASPACRASRRKIVSICMGITVARRRGVSTHAKMCR